jgi:hypothetical protein
LSIRRKRFRTARLEWSAQNGQNNRRNAKEITTGTERLKPYLRRIGTECQPVFIMDENGLQ